MNIQNQAIKIYQNDWCILEGTIHEIIQNEAEILIDMTSSRSGRRKLVLLIKREGVSLEFEAKENINI